ncbi:hypothetical protein A2331_02615 [Candidatus Falkowbacteria bacterium RIFOXYB2_FULL_34_18]|uniref:NodB homology domain-containing protein n=1 Tax=Candidatus Falkowbacteria bacterium RIFOXYD2_FULL_34_120 TaxID=1798007 RepID=A0A1F5TRR1_9BACT|nr:MAG: hypothetical protein A2331_02615 [Candidatus Falkowbacteria bacterium RIFOXYB2_FULL_34_18]OGF29633.1 MAG: hypothetical protein A2500_00645 [Candidatus Falkowbacteria bacterium RIFOXYC12_FULL_34_55]OGF37360.1 MAG: hypothetical protein A2466_01415 [Candidatus Falkowbacteria bacterium RIFOXYC2_FULL_34_220]OGF39098.1 MAG: hypothetical protein A2515_00065 [Candidatus Falkowbacteria bacterium RIFOXYD12_FULL_34_57]OGF41622.1 MAG: hypothetical protein A2531_06300 [Candidatus Falkowbacteria bact
MKYILYPIFKIIDSLFPPKGLPVLMYHSISSHKSRLAVSPEMFDRQMKYLKDRGYEAILPNNLNSLKNYKKKVMITFDDGFRDNYTTALPIMEKYGFKAAVFISTDYIGGKASYCRKDNDKNLEMMNEEEIKELDKREWCIGSHFASHKDLDMISEDEIKDEYQKSHDKLKNILGDGEMIFSYPHSKYNERVISILSINNIKMAFAGKNIFYTPKDSKYALSRIEVPGYYQEIDKFSFLLLNSFMKFKYYVR